MHRLVLGLLFFTLAALGQFADVDVLAEHWLKEQNVPGLAVGVIQDGKIVLARGYGVRELRERKPVTTKTLFGVGSVSKSFTSAVLATDS